MTPASRDILSPSAAEPGFAHACDHHCRADCRNLVPPLDPNNSQSTPFCARETPVPASSHSAASSGKANQVARSNDSLSTDVRIQSRKEKNRKATSVIARPVQKSDFP